MAQSGRDSVEGWLDAVDCVTAGNCVAVGNESTSGGASAKALVETLSHGTWTPMLAPDAVDSPGDWLLSVSCPAIGSCAAVGYYFSLHGGGSATGLIETLSGGTWRVSGMPALPGVTDSFLNGVSCPTPSRCVAVGYTYSRGASYYRPLVVSLHDAGWSVDSTPALGSGGGLFSVTCATFSACTAVGYRSRPGAGDSMLIETTRRRTWTIAPSPGSGHGPVLTHLAGVSCPSSDACLAVGQEGGHGPVIEGEREGTWSIVATPDADTADVGTSLDGISCTTTAACVAVGALAGSSGTRTPAGALGTPLDPMLETDAGGRWEPAAEPSDLPADSGLQGVSCAGQSCVAVGQSGQFTSPGSVAHTLILQAAP